MVRQKWTCKTLKTVESDRNLLILIHVLWPFKTVHSYQADDLAEVGWIKNRGALEKLSDPQQAETDFLKCGRPMLEHIAVRGLMFDVSTLIY